MRKDRAAGTVPLGCAATAPLVKSIGPAEERCCPEGGFLAGDLTSVQQADLDGETKAKIFA